MLLQKWNVKPNNKPEVGGGDGWLRAGAEAFWEDRVSAAANQRPDDITEDQSEPRKHLSTVYKL